MLHGEIKVNNQVIGDWTAVRTERVLPDELDREHNPTFYRYACTMNYRDQRGYPMVATYDVVHRYGDGAVLLAAKVLAKGQINLVRKPVDEFD